jgi:hypothetical protein
VSKNVDKLEPASSLLNRILDERRANWEAEQLKSFEERITPKNDRWKENYKEPPQADVSSLPEIPDSWTWATITQLGELNRENQSIDHVMTRVYMVEIIRLFKLVTYEQLMAF